MASAFSSSDADVIGRENDLETEQHQIPTSLDRIIDVYEIKRCVKYIKYHSCKNVALQFPDHMLIDATPVTKELQSKTAAKVYLLADTSYGSYDVDEVAAQHIQADLIIHYGKSSLAETARTNTIFVFGRIPLNNDDVCLCFQQTYSNHDEKIVVLVALPWSHAAESLKGRLGPNYSQMVIADVHTPKQLHLSSDPDLDDCPNACPDCTCKLSKGQLRPDTDDMDTDDNNYGIGCYKMQLAADSTLEDYSLFFVGNPENETLRNLLLQHPSCKGHIFDPTTSTCSPLQTKIKKTLMKRYYIVEQIKDAKTVGILVGTMGMAGYLEIIDHLKKILSACGKKTYTFVVGKLNPNKLANFPEIDIFVFVACAEESLIDHSEYYKSICTPYEVELACNENREWGNTYPLDFRQLLPGGKHHVEFKACTYECDISLITGNIRSRVNGSTDNSNEIEVRNTDSTLSLFHPHAAAHHYSDRSWKGLEQKLGQTLVVPAKEGRSGLPTSYTNGAIS